MKSSNIGKAWFLKSCVIQSGLFYVLLIIQPFHRVQTPIHELISVTLTENSSVATNDTQGPQKYLYHQKQLQRHTSMWGMALKLSQYFYLPIEKPLGFEPLLPSLVSLISGCTVQPENTYFFHSLWKCKYDPLFPINKPTLSPLWVSPPSLKTAGRKTP